MRIQPAHRRRVGLCALAATALSTPAFAGVTGGGGLPWDTVLQTVEADLTGPVAIGIGVIAVILCGLGIAMGGEGSAMRRLFAILFGLSLAFMSASAITTFFGASSGAAF